MLVKKTLLIPVHHKILRRTLLFSNVWNPLGSLRKATKRTRFSGPLKGQFAANGLGLFVLLSLLGQSGQVVDYNIPYNHGVHYVIAVCNNIAQTNDGSIFRDGCLNFFFVNVNQAI